MTIKTIRGVAYHVKSPSLFQVAADSSATVQVGYLGPSHKWGVRLQRDDKPETAKAGFERDEAFALVAKGFGFHV